MKILSILVPVYNTEKYIKRCLDSILVKEVLNDIEVILVNDGSKDNSIELLKEYEKKYSKTVVLVDKKNGGHGSTINEGLKIATGKYFRVLDSDDWFDTCNFIKFIKKLKKCDEDLIVTPYFQEYVYNGQELLFEYSEFENDKIYYFDNLDLKKLNDFYFVMASSTYKLSVLKDSKLKLYENTFYVDMQYNVIPVEKTNTIRFLDNNIYRYFIGRPNQSMSNESMIRNMPNHEKVLKFLISYYNSHQEVISKNKLDYIKKIIALMSYTHINLIGIQWKSRLESYKLIKKFASYLKETNIDIYNEVMKNSYFRYSKKFGFLNVLICNKLFLKLLNLFRKIKKRRTQ